jgi:hypothetical protein
MSLGFKIDSKSFSEPNNGRRIVQRRWIILPLFLATPLGLTSCKPNAGDVASETKTLDNFARSEGQQAKPSTCGINLSKEQFSRLSETTQKKLRKRIDAPSEELFFETAGALASVPKIMQTILFFANGQIKVVENPAASCKDTLTQAEIEFAGEGAKSIDVCWKDSKSKDRVDIYIKADKRVIRHSLVRIFAYLYTQFFVKRISENPDVASDITDNIKDLINRFRTQRRELAKSFMADTKAPKRLQALAQKDGTAFENYVFAEAIDSFYCSKKTYDAFKANFDKTFKSFTKSPDDTKPLSVDFGKPKHAQKP